MSNYPGPREGAISRELKAASLTCSSVLTELGLAEGALSRAGARSHKHEFGNAAGMENKSQQLSRMQSSAFITPWADPGPNPNPNPHSCPLQVPRIMA